MSDPVEDAIASHHAIQEARHVQWTAVSGRLAEFYTPSEIDIWLRAPHPQLRGESAMALILRGDAAEVHRVIDRLESDGYL